MTEKTHYRACHLCEAICGLEIKTVDEEIVSIKGDKDDPFSRGHICPKAVALKDIHQDPDRLKFPLKKVDNEWVEIKWEQAFKEIAARLNEIQLEHGDNSIAVYAGNPNVHNYGSMTHARALRKPLNTRNNFSATSLDQLPHHLVSFLMYGHQFLVPVPDIDRTHFMLIFGANPIASNGSMMTVPDVKKRLKSIQLRGGRVVVFDPRRTETADLSDEHVFVTPGTDAWVLLAMINTLFEEDLVRIGKLESLTPDASVLADLIKPFSPGVAEKFTGVSAETIIRITREFSNAKSAVCYGRMGVSVQGYGTLCQWAIQVLNLLTGNLDSEGGAMFPGSAVGYVKPGEPSPGHYGRFHSRISGQPSFSGEFPTSILAEEILEAGEGQIKGLISIAGNPVLSSPNGRQLDDALESLKLMVSVDIYLNETTRHADYILPPTSPLEHDHYDVAFFRLAVRNVTRYNTPIFEPPEGTLHDWQILNGLGAELAKVKGKQPIILPPPHVIIDMGLKTGPYSESNGHAAKLSLDELLEHPHGIDLGALESGLEHRICNESKMIEMVPSLITEELERLVEEFDSKRVASTQHPELPLLLIGRRDIRSNNSWMHNSHRLVKGKPRWHCLMHPEDMASRSLQDGQRVMVRSRVGAVETIVQAADEVMPGVISMPHGWGHNREGVMLNVASEQQAPSINDLTDDKYVDQSSGNAALNGVPCQVYVA